MKRNRYLTRDEMAAEISATRDLPLDHIEAVFDELVMVGVPVDALVKMQVDELDPA